MVTKTKNNTSQTKNAYLGVRVLFVVIWFVLVALLVNSNLLQGLLDQSNTDVNNFIVAIILLVPITIVVFPVMSRIGDVYNVSEKKSITPKWKRYVIGLVGTSILLGIIFYLFTIITFTLFYRF